MLATTSNTTGGYSHDLDIAESLALGLTALVAVVGALVLSVVLHAVFSRLGRRSVVATDLARRGRRPVRLLLAVLAVHQVAHRSLGTNEWLHVVRSVLDLALIASVAWVVAALAFVGEDVVLARYRVDVADNRHARRVRTQVTFLRRITVGVIIVLTVAAMLWTIPGARQFGAGIFASAGLLSVVAGLAAQTSLANVFAGLQLAFTDALRVDDVVVVQGEWGRIEEITLTYVVVHLWDDRRLVLPSTWFTSTPFENWTRKDSQLLGIVMLEVDWSTDFDAMREELRRTVEGDELWDGRVSVLQVTDAVGSYVQVRILVSAQDGPTVFDLRCHVREAMVRWLASSDPAGLPRLRVDGVPDTLADRLQRPAPRTPATAPLPAVAPPGPGQASRDDSLFTGSLDAVERSRRFSGPSEADQAERAAHDRAAHGSSARDGDETQVLPAVPESPRPRG